MDDLAGLNWSAPNQKPASAATPAQSAPTNPAIPTYPSLRPTPSPFASGRNSPLPAQGSGNAGTKSPAPKIAPDSFGNLLNFGTGKSNANLSLRERQDQLEAEKRKKEEERRRQAQAQYGDGSFLDSLGQTQSSSLRTPSPAISVPSSLQGLDSGTHNGKPATESDDDLFAAFNASTKVDNSSYFPPPASSNTPSSANAPALDLSNPQAWNTSGAPAGTSVGGGFADEDDDPFGLNQLKSNTSPPPPPAADGDDDDLLGDLAKPVDQVRKKTGPVFAREPEPGKPIEDSSSESEAEPPAPSDDPFDRAVAQLVEYGFTPENARRGLTESGAGLNVQAAVNWLLDDAHRQAKEKQKGGRGAGERSTERGERASSQSRSSTPSWTKEGQSGGGARGRDNRSPASLDGDFAKAAAAVGSSFLKSANNLWKTGQKKVQKAVAEFQQDGDPSQPKWMRSAQGHGRAEDTGRQIPEVTDEALMLEMGGPPGTRPGKAAPQRQDAGEARLRETPPALPTRPGKGNQAPRWQQAPQQFMDPRSRLGRQGAEEETFQAYVSPARRKKPAAQPQPEAKPAETDEDLLFGEAAPTSRAAPQTRSAQPSPSPQPSSRPPPPAPRPAAPRPARQIPGVSAIALQNSTRCRLEGTAHFKRGDFAAAHASYTASMTAIPQDHPLTILLLCNRALTALKTGDPRQAVQDADAAIQLIGPGKGEGEYVELQTTDGTPGEKRDMRDLYGKALTRKAEALEQMEKWADAGAVWQLCIEAGLGGATAAAGRQRCQKAVAPKPASSTPKPASASRAAAPPRPRPSANPQKSFEAVERLRAAHQAAEREGDEKLALADKVDARIAAWRDGKRDNLRALLSSLDTVLWEGSGWKKVGLHELVMANKVKVVYMKAIAKTHPDKIAQDATTEVRMIAATVFSTLNEAWDKFKAENNL
ncbi:hypothetical protein MYCTH_2301004 [Thermothelomyces thermophilus ATCC 42464]|uniref:UBA domain-containing protein n=1 Tax=Thermothelomyces thermophilus (strain ATCC 42464 / BCRC 31852 / DSM 1799) TaxID=573729 RepID=G2Q8S3_THET4|nr:uncharacterized protein MYCTH_2301004 [Thermothelomyces thermophilus ATCC 42464]AEO56268.1 hypothetical protein MYCTH_2301004 [Thermothelomyces thermophilus ATCC 42464]